MTVTVTPPGGSTVAAGTGAGASAVQETPLTPVSGTAAANTAVPITVNGVAGQTIRLAALSWSYSAAPAGGVLTAVVNGVTIFQCDITAAGFAAALIAQGGLICQAGQNAVITLAAAGAAVIGRLNVGYYYGP
ncbi:MAG TPA: hypothetical protein VIX86_19195 [Streptosporangiaceae bacterium]